MNSVHPKQNIVITDFFFRNSEFLVNGFNYDVPPAKRHVSSFSASGAPRVVARHVFKTEYDKLQTAKVHPDSLLGLLRRSFHQWPHLMKLDPLTSPGVRS